MPSPITPFFGATVAFFVACLVLGGGSRAGFLSDAVLQVLAIPLLLWALWRLIDIPPDLGRGRARAAVLVCLLAAALPLMQLIPLPPSLWSALPGRTDFISALEATGLEAGWRPLSMSPRGTWLSALALLPPAAVLLSVLQLGYVERRRLAFVWLAIGMIAVALGLLQVAQGTASRLRFFAFTNTTETVGFFANRNHHAALLYCLVLIAAAVFIAAVVRAIEAGSFRSRRAIPHVAVAVLGLAALVILVAAQAIARSRAGLALTLVALLGALAMTYAARSGRSDPKSRTSRSAAARTGRQLLMAAFGLAILLGGRMAFFRVQDRFETSGIMLDGRGHWARYTIDAALAYMPFGAGMGSFMPVYQAFEKPTDNWGALINRAHNDYLELWLEASLIGIVAALLVLAWVALSLLRVWRHGLPGAGLRDNLLACAAGLIPVLLLAHSTVDYPLRTAALMAVFALASAMVVAPVGPQVAVVRILDAPVESSEKVQPRSMPERERAVGRSPAGPFAPAPPRSDWPAAWQTPRRGGPSDVPLLPDSEAANDQDERNRR